jgi:hypothetical protein
MATMNAGRSTPVHLWIVGILALLWNGFGCFDYLMTMTKNAAYISNFPAEQMAYFESLPNWLTAFWAVGVWGGLAGALLLLMRSRYAVLAFALSAIGAVVTFAYQAFATEMPASMKEGSMALIPLLIVALALFFAWYSWSLEKKRVLR